LPITITSQDAHDAETVNPKTQKICDYWAMRVMAIFL
jgi:hypothetical protein